MPRLALCAVLTMTVGVTHPLQDVSSGIDIQAACIVPVTVLHRLVLIDGDENALANLALLDLGPFILAVRGLTASPIVGTDLWYFVSARICEWQCGGYRPTRYDIVMCDLLSRFRTLSKARTESQ